MDAGDMRELLDSWLIALEAERKSPHTVKQYRTGVRFFLDWCDANGEPPDMTDPGPARRWLADLARQGLQGSTLNSRFAALRAFAMWLLAEDEIGAAGITRVGRPKIDEKAPPALTRAQIEAILGACAADKGFEGIRDEAMFSLMFDALVRSDELCAMAADGDVNVRDRTVRVRRGKGGRERWSAFSAQTARRVDRYQRARRRHKHAADPAFWVGRRGGLTYPGLYAAFKRRAEAAGVEAFPHMLRAGGAVNWRRQGGSTESLLTIAGWRDVRMAMRYTKVAERELALEEARRLFDGQ
ncbi:tyrosine-type recombinase/integrase [Trebonia sp.]|uniref:tyrosine-type recombinase/integrase n=1 Tax=Trebonia sp. TaxID=2767075 RepID=UPI002601B39C|nr:tyrosine-type recombinase/integrase [Trebonia sp.]